ncbi:MAG TPA: aspartate 1-decarboxylase [Armatimonadetes bacterium]|nr:aspartate 1-decarboxylase [Armatimonadota bacterium]
MMRIMLKSKIHGATVTETNLNYEGSLTLDANLIEAADLLPNEQVHVLNVTNGARFVTYIIEGERGSGTVCVNGAAARLVQTGDRILILSYELIHDEEMRNHRAKVVHVDDQNRIIEVKEMPSAMQVSIAG